jgi:hypothetical protein
MTRAASCSAPSRGPSRGPRWRAGGERRGRRSSCRPVARPSCAGPPCGRPGPAVEEPELCVAPCPQLGWLARVRRVRLDAPELPGRRAAPAPGRRAVLRASRARRGAVEGAQLGQLGGELPDVQEPDLPRRARRRKPQRFPCLLYFRRRGRKNFGD